MQKTDICCLQEHWLFKFQLDRLDGIFPGVVSHAKAVDEIDPISPLQVPRGYGGTAILFLNSWTFRSNKHEDGNHRITTLTTDTSPKLCIVSVYLPCRGNSRQEDFKASLDLLEEICNKFAEHVIFICGDLNASLSRNPPNDRDNLLKSFVQSMGLTSQQNGTPTFFHENKEQSAELDYILKNPLACSVSSIVHIEDDQSNNVSDQLAVSTTLNISSSRKTKPTLSYPKPNWDRCNTEKFQRAVNCNIDKIKDDLEKGKLIESIYSLKTTLDNAAVKNIPGYHPNKPRKLKRNQKISSPEIVLASKISKKAWWKWKLAGQPNSNLHPLKKSMKTAKYQLRRIQRQASSRLRQQNMEDIMNSHPSDNRTFYKLIAAQRSKGSSSINCLIYDDKELTTKETITEGWADYFQSLAIPANDCNYDNEYLVQTESFYDEICNHLQRNMSKPDPVSTVEINSAIKKLNNNKAVDIFGLTAEHLKYGGPQLQLVLKDLLNSVLLQGKIPAVLKKGIITPVFKKGDPSIPGNYRGITVTPVLLKLLEHVLNNRHKKILRPSQSLLQTGFTEGTSCINSALIISECQLESKATKTPLFFITLDTRKAFDVVNHQILLRNLFFDGIENCEWLLIKNMYEDATSIVKWEGIQYKPIEIKQGVRQGGVMSTEHYKRYNNPLLIELEEKFTGVKIGNIKIPHTTCADDLALLS